MLIYIAEITWSSDIFHITALESPKFAHHHIFPTIKHITAHVPLR